jgi:uncharacterized Zn finger protein (UPF0148 family)
MLNEYECEKCGSICYTESEIWEFCPICEETPEERSLRKRAEHAERERDRLREERDELLNSLIDLLREASPYTPMSKHLLRECEDAEKTLEKLGGTN